MFYKFNVVTLCLSFSNLINVYLPKPVSYPTKYCLFTVADYLVNLLYLY